MTYEEAVEWANGERSTTNMIPQYPMDTWVVRICQADAAMAEQAYWTIKARAALKELEG